MVMPVLNPLLGIVKWEEVDLTIGPITMKWGLFISALINFIILAVVVFMIVKILHVDDKKKTKK